MEWWNQTDLILSQWTDVSLNEIVDASRARGDAADYWKMIQREPHAGSVALALSRVQGLKEWPSGLQESVRLRAEKAVLRFVSMEEEMLRVVQSLHAVSRRCLLEGPLARAYLYYPQPYFRPVETIDLVVEGHAKRVDLSVLRFLGKCGYRDVTPPGESSSGVMFLQRGSGAQVYPRVRLRSRDLEEFEELYQRSVPLKNTVPSKHESEPGQENLQSIRSLVAEDDWIELMRSSAKDVFSGRAVDVWRWVDIELLLRQSHSWVWATMLPALTHTSGMQALFQMLTKQRKVTLPKAVKQVMKNQFFSEWTGWLRTTR